MSIIHVKGDLLESDCNVIVHQANCFASMGGGIARQIAQRYPSVLKADCDYHIAIGDAARMGHYSYADVDGPHGTVKIINLYSQYNYGRGKQTNNMMFELGLDQILTKIKSSGQENIKIGLPFKIGCGLAGGDWNIIEAIIERLADQHNVDIYLYEFTPVASKEYIN